MEIEVKLVKKDVELRMADPKEVLSASFLMVARDSTTGKSGNFLSKPHL
jgi:hypothetical protein